MDYTIEAIPTVYKGRNYRSRLEAKWAAFFDLCGWRYEYEPVDLNGWFPDFALYGDQGNRILVEVKPLFPLELRKGRSDIMDVLAKMERAAGGQKFTMMLVGQKPMSFGIGADNPHLQEYGKFEMGEIGLIADSDILFDDARQTEGMTSLGEWSGAVCLWGHTFFCCDAYGKKGFMRWSPLDLKGEHGFTQHEHFPTGNMSLVAKRGQLESLWNQAANVVQWKP